jgi:hypothetical protein
MSVNASSASINNKLGGLLIIIFLILGINTIPVPGPGPGPGPNNQLLKQEGLYVLVVEEREDRPKLPDDQLVLLQGTALKEYVINKGGQFRQLDDDVIDTMEDGVWKDAMIIISNTTSNTTPWWIVSNTPKGGVSEAFPMDLESAKKTIEAISNVR